MTKKIFFIRLIILIAILVLVDIGMRFVFQSQSKSVINNKITYVLNESDEDILVFGSSRTEHHYIPSIISDSLGLTSFNAGNAMHEIYANHTLFKLTTERYSPKIVILDIFQIFLTQERMWSYRYVNDYYFLYNKYDIVKKNIDLFWPYAPIIMQIYSYKNRELIMHVLQGKPDYSSQIKGYNPQTKVMSKTQVIHPYTEDYVTLCAEKLLLIDDIITTCKEKDIELIFVMSPMYHTLVENSVIYQFEEYLNERDVPFLNYVNYDALMHTKYFRDPTHLNDAGAQIFTSAVISDIKKLLKD